MSRQQEQVGGLIGWGRSLAWGVALMLAVTASVVVLSTGAAEASYRIGDSPPCQEGDRWAAPDGRIYECQNGLWRDLGFVYQEPKEGEPCVKQGIRFYKSDGSSLLCIPTPSGLRWIQMDPPWADRPKRPPNRADMAVVYPWKSSSNPYAWISVWDDVNYQFAYNEVEPWRDHPDLDTLFVDDFPRAWEVLVEVPAHGRRADWESYLDPWLYQWIWVPVHPAQPNGATANALLDAAYAEAGRPRPTGAVLAQLGQSTSVAEAPGAPGDNHWSHVVLEQYSDNELAVVTQAGLLTGSHPNFTPKSVPPGWLAIATALWYFDYDYGMWRGQAGTGWHYNASTSARMADSLSAGRPVMPDTYYLGVAYVAHLLDSGEWSVCGPLYSGDPIYVGGGSSMAATQIAEADAKPLPPSPDTLPDSKLPKAPKPPKDGKKVKEECHKQPKKKG